jgi:hypothetical protein
MGQDLISHLESLEKDVMEPTNTTAKELSDFSKEIGTATNQAVNAIYQDKERNATKIGMAMLNLKGLIEKYAGSKSTKYLAEKVLPFYKYIRQHAMALYAIQMETIALNIRHYTNELSELKEAATTLPKMYAMI